MLAVRTGLEPVISHVTGGRPLQLDRQTNKSENGIKCVVSYAIRYTIRRLRRSRIRTDAFFVQEKIRSNTQFCYWSLFLDGDVEELCKSDFLVDRRALSEPVHYHQCLTKAFYCYDS